MTEIGRETLNPSRLQAARKLEPPVPSRIGHLAGRDYVDSLLQVLEIGAVGPLTRPLPESVSNAEKQELHNFVIAQLRTAEDIRRTSRCTIDEKAFQRTLRKHERALDIFVPSTGASVSRAAGLMIAIDGTMHVLRAKEMRAKSADRQWPDTLEMDSDLCESVGWGYEKTADGAMSVRYTGDAKTAGGGALNPAKLVYRSAKPD